MARFITLEVEEYDHLNRMERMALEQNRTLDMVLDIIKEHAGSFDNKTVYVSNIETPEELANIFRYRMPEEWKELEAEVIERETRGITD